MRSKMIIKSLYRFLKNVISLCSAIAFVVLFSDVCSADKESLVDAVDNARKAVEPENNKYQSAIEEVYNTMKKARPSEVQIPSYNIFAKDQAVITDIMGLPETSGAVAAEESCADPERLGDYKIFIFISSSVPDTALGNYMADAVKVKDALLVLNGAIGSADYIKPTQDFITGISCGKKLEELKVGEKCDVSRVDINPLLFRLFNVQKVPAVVYSKLSYSDLMIRANTSKPVGENEYYVIRGDTALLYAMEKFHESGADTVKYADILRGGY